MTNFETSGWRRRFRTFTDRIDAITHGIGDRWHRLGDRYRSIRDPLLVWHDAVRNRPLTMILSLLAWALIVVVTWSIATSPATAIRVGIALFISCTTLYLCLLFSRGSVKQASVDERRAFETSRWIDPADLPEKVREKLLPGERVIYITKAHPMSWIATMTWRWAGLLVAALGLFLVYTYHQLLPLALLLALVPMFIKIWDWLRDFRTLTNKRGFRVWGVFKSHFGEMPRERLLSIALDGTVPGKLLSKLRIIRWEYANIRVESAAPEEALRDQNYMPQPNRYQLLARDEDFGRLDLEPETANDGT